MNSADFLRLGRWKVSAVAALSAYTGAAAFSAHYALTPHVGLPAAGTLALALGASALNQVQERELDAHMERTLGRPIPAGRVGPRGALWLSALLLGAGELTLLAGSGAAAVLGALAVIWYNGVYTPLKRRTPFAAVPGAFVGAVPPAIGWVSAGGFLLDPRLGVLCLFFFLWQVPHFWLLLRHTSADCQRAGLPSLDRVLSPPQARRVTFIWLTAAAAASLLLPLWGLGTPRLAMIYPVLGWSLLAVAGVALRRRTQPSPLPRFAFQATNIYLLATLALLVADRIARIL